MAEKGQDGDFLVRDSESTVSFFSYKFIRHHNLKNLFLQTGDFSVSLKAPGRNKHFRVHVENGMYCIGQRKFVSLQQLVDHYQVTLATFQAIQNICNCQTLMIRMSLTLKIFSLSSNYFLITESPHLHITERWKTVFNQTTSKINTSEDASDEDVKDLVLEWMIRVEQKVKHKKSSKLLTKVLYVSKLKPTICRYCKNEAKFAVMLFLWYFKW